MEPAVLCSVEETIEHLFLRCLRLGGLFKLFDSWFQGFGEEFSQKVFVGGLKYKVLDRGKLSLLNYLIAKRKNKELELGSTDVEMMLNMVKG